MVAATAPRRAAPAPSYDPALAAERALLGALLLDAQALERVRGLRTTDFATEQHREIFAAIVDEAATSGVTDMVAVHERLERGGRVNGSTAAYLAELAQNTPSTLNVHRYADLVIEHARLRELARLGAELQERAQHPIADSAALLRNLEQRLERIEAPELAPVALDLAALSAQTPQPPAHIIYPWLPAGEVTLFAGHGGAGKSAIALHLAVCTALGLPWCGLETTRRPVLYLSAEDPVAVLHWRLARICAHLDLKLEDLAGRLTIIDASHLDAELMLDTGRGDEPTVTALYEALRRRIADPATLLMLDGASDLYGASEIVRRHVRRFIRALRRLVGPEGAVVLLAHLDKAAARDSSVSDRYSGSTSWHNSVRSRWALGAEADNLVLTLAKANHAKAGAEIRLRWDESAHLHLVDQPTTEGGIVGAIRERQEREGILGAISACTAAGISVPAATQGPRTAFHVLRAQAAFPESLRSDTAQIRRKFWAEIEHLRAFGTIEDQVLRAKHGHKVPVLALKAGAS